MIVADNQRLAEEEAERCAGTDGSGPSAVCAHEVQKLDQIAVDWEDSIPFGGDRKDERTCRERVTPNDRTQRRRATEQPHQPEAAPRRPLQ